MRLSRASTYAVVATVCVASHHGQPIPARVICATCGIPRDYLRKILQQLVRARILKSEAGRRGGFMLLKSADHTNLLEIVEAIDGRVSAELVTASTNGGGDALHVRLQAICDDITDHTKRLFRKTTIQQLISSE